MTDTIKNDMYGKIKNAKALAAKALGQVDLGAKVLTTNKPAKANLDIETKTSKNATSESVESKGAPDIKGKILANICLKKADAKTEEPVTKSKLVEESAADPVPVKKIPDEVTKAQKAKALAKAKKADAGETKVK